MPKLNKPRSKPQLSCAEAEQLLATHGIDPATLTVAEHGSDGSLFLATGSHGTVFDHDPDFTANIAKALSVVGVEVRRT